MGNGITIIGLGPGAPDLLTLQAWQELAQASEIYLRTRQHPVVAGFPEGLQVHSFDHLYEAGRTFDGVYEQIIARVLELGQREQGVLYAVPGHPYVAEATSPEIVRRARQAGLPVRVLEGLSFIEPTLTALEVDPFPHLALVDALELAAGHAPSFPPSAPALIGQIHSRQVAANVKLTLMNLYPDEHPVRLVHAAGMPEQAVEDLPLYEIDRSARTGLLTSLYLPPLGPTVSFEALHEVVAHLRAPEGCPWDREQTHRSLRSGLLEETYEVLAAIDADDPHGLQEELGDLILVLMMQAQIAAESGEFSLADVLQGVNAKLIRRHPHVFGEAQVEGVQGVLQNWERLKAEERAANGKAESGLLAGVSQALPALVQADQYLKRAARVGFDWPDLGRVVAKLEEELREVHAAGDDDERAAEAGDLLFAVVNLARWYRVDPESALREANGRFRQRFEFIETAARQGGRSVADFSLEEMETLWRQAKQAATFSSGMAHQ